MGHNGFRYWCALVAAGGFFLVGCGSSDPPAAPSETAPPPAPAAKVEQTAQPEAVPAEPSKPEIAYEAPFPNRQNLFRPMRDIRPGDRNDRESGESVVLRGFAKVDEPKVLLTIDGIDTQLAEGAEMNGVQVIAIQEPEVILHRDRIRWTAKLQ